MARWVVAVTFKSNGFEYRKGNVVELTTAQVNALGATNFRAVNNPIGANGTAPSTPTHDTLGEATGVSNSS